MKDPNLQNIIDTYLKIENKQSYATILTQCCYHGLKANTPGLDILVDIANLLSQVLTLFDDIIDNDIDLSFWQTQFSEMDSVDKVRGSILNLGTSLFALIGQKFTILCDIEAIPVKVSRKIQEETFHAVIPIIQGQQESIIVNSPSLTEAIQIAQLKSGKFYGLVCWNAAYLAKFDLHLAESFRELGQIFGMIVQIANDMSGVWPDGDKPSDLKLGAWTLPIAYTLSVVPQTEQKHFISLLALAPGNEDAEQQVREILIKSGAFVYWQIENQMRMNQAKEMLSKLLVESPHREKLVRLISDLVSVTGQ